MNATLIRPHLGALALAATLILAACGGGDATPPAESEPPGAVFSSSEVSGTATGPVTFTFTFSEDVGTSFTADDVVVSGGGAKGAFTKVSATQYTLVVTPPANSAGSMSVTIVPNGVADLVGNTRAEFFPLPQRFDTRPPVVSIASSAAGTAAAGDVIFTFSFSKDVGSSFAAGDITVTGGTATTFATTSGTGATLVVRPPADSGGTLQVSVPAGAVADSGGTTNNVAATLSQPFNTAVPSTTLVTFSEAPAPLLAGFGGAEDATVVNDPTNAANKVARIVKSATAELWAGTTVSICPNQAIQNLPFSATLTTLTARVWSPAAGVPVRMKVENAADGTKSVETEATTTVANAWQTLSFNFANPAAGTAALNLANTYNKVSVFFNFGTPGAATGARTYYLDDIAWRGSTISAACPSTGGGGGDSARITMDESPAPVLTGFGGAEDATIANDPAGGSNKVAKVVKSATAELWAGVTFSTAANQSIPAIGFSDSNKTITVRVWSPTAGTPVRLKVENAADGSKSVETEASTTVANAWQTLSFNFANPAAGTAALNLANTYNKASIFFNFGTTGAAAGGARTYYFDDITYPAAAGGGNPGGGGATGPVVFASGYRQGGATAQGGNWGYFSGDFANYSGNTFTGGGFADSNPPVADAEQFFFIAVTTTAPTAPAGNPPSSGGFIGMFVTHPGLTLNGQTSIAVNLGIDGNFFRQASNKSIDVFIVGATNYTNGSGGDCKVTLKGSITPTTDAMRTYTVALSSFALVQPCQGGGFNSGVTNATQALAQPIGAVNTQFTFPNVNTTINSGTAAAPIYATGITRGRTAFQ